MFRMTGPSFLVRMRMCTSYFDTVGSRPTSRARIYLERETCQRLNKGVSGPPWPRHGHVPHRIAQSILLHILQVLLSELARSSPICLGVLLLPLALGLGVVLLEASDLLKTRENRRNWLPPERQTT